MPLQPRKLKALGNRPGNAVRARPARSPLNKPWPTPPPIQLSLPDWLFKRWQKDWPDDADAMARANLQTPPFTLRVNRQQQQRADALTALGEGARAGSVAPYSIYLQPARPVFQLPGFEQGALSVQDKRQLPANCGTRQRPHSERLRGSKMGAARNSPPQTSPPWSWKQATGPHPQNLARLTPRHPAARRQHPQSWWDGTPFVILLDAPCSATGILQPDVKWHRKASDIPALVDLQARMLDALWPLLNPGGMLVYATCSVLRRATIGS